MAQSPKGPMMGMIYGLIDEDELEVRYVGMTIVSPARRFSVHMSKRGPNAHLNNWLKATRVGLIVLDEVENDALGAAEICWIREMRIQGARLLNITDGGDGGKLGFHFTEASKAKMRAARLGCRASQETREKISRAQVGRIVTWGGKISAGRRSHIASHSGDCICTGRIGDYTRGRPWSETRREAYERNKKRGL